jgi:hypothetical protein
MLYVGVPVNVLPNVSASFPPPTFPIFEENGSPSVVVQPNPTPFSAQNFWLQRLQKKTGLPFFSYVFIVFLSKYETKNLVLMLLMLSKFSPSVLSIDVGHALQLSTILSIFIKRKVPRSYPSSASFLGIDLIISVFVSSHMDGLKLSSIYKPSFCARLSSSYC